MKDNLFILKQLIQLFVIHSSVITRVLLLTHDFIFHIQLSVIELRNFYSYVLEGI